MSKKISWIIGIVAVVVLIAAFAVSRTELYKGFLPELVSPFSRNDASSILYYHRLAFSPSDGGVIYISYQTSGSLGKHEVIIYNSKNQAVRKLSSFNYMTTPGASYVDLWNGRDDRGNLVMPGVYTYSIEGYELVPARQGESNVGRKLQPIQGVIEVLGRQPVAAPAGPSPAPTGPSPVKAPAGPSPAPSQTKWE